jgi:hypothetical protein
MEKSLVAAGSAGPEMQGALRDREGIAVPVEDGLAVGQQLGERLRKIRAMSKGEPADLPLAVAPHLAPEDIGKELGAQANPQDRLGRPDRLPEKISSDGDTASSWTPSARRRSASRNLLRRQVISPKRVQLTAPRRPPAAIEPTLEGHMPQVMDTSEDSREELGALGLGLSKGMRFVLR